MKTSKEGNGNTSLSGPHTSPAQVGSARNLVIENWKKNKHLVGTLGNILKNIFTVLVFTVLTISCQPAKGLRDLGAASHLTHLFVPRAVWAKSYLMFQFQEKLLISKDLGDRGTGDTTEIYNYYVCDPLLLMNSFNKELITILQNKIPF